MSATQFWNEVAVQMGETEQEAVWHRMRALYGDTAYTLHSRQYKLVGFKRRSGEKVFAVGETWTEAVERLARKAAL